MGDGGGKGEGGKGGGPDWGGGREGEGGGGRAGGEGGGSGCKGWGWCDPQDNMVRWTTMPQIMLFQGVLLLAGFHPQMTNAAIQPLDQSQ